MSRSTTFRVRRSRTNWPLGNNSSWKPPPVLRNEIVPIKEDESTDWSLPPNVVSHNLALAEEPYEGGPLNMRGYLYHPRTKKYFKMTNENGPNNSFYSRHEYERREKARAERFAANRPRFTSGSFVQRPVVKNVVNMLSGIEIGAGRSVRNHRHIDEMRLLNCTPKPTFSIRTPVMEMGPLTGCEFLEASESGDRIVGCFTISGVWPYVPERKFSTVYVFEAECLQSIVEEEKQRKENENGSSGYNTMGLLVQALDNEDSDYGYGVTDKSIVRFEDFIVDQTLAQIDRDVTCLLTVTAADEYRPNGVVSSYCTVHLNALSEFSDPECVSSVSSPIYNRRWREKGSIWSVGWNAQEMCIGFGLEDCFRMENILSNRSFTLSSKKRNVIGQCFSNDGKLVMMGLRHDDVIKSDLRMNRDHITGQLYGSKSTAFVKILSDTHPECVITEGFNAKLQLWDFRWPNKPLMVFKGHKNSHNRLPCFVDAKEKFVFAVGSDGVTRGWSLQSGDMLCAVESPREGGNQTNFPRVVYSENWGGRPGNAALILAVGNTMRVHVLDF